LKVNILCCNSENLEFSRDILTRAGNVSDLLGQFLDEQIRVMDDPDNGMTILKSFVSIHGTKRQMTESGIDEAIKTFGNKLSESELISILRDLLT